MSFTMGRCPAVGSRLPKQLSRRVQRPGVGNGLPGLHLQTSWASHESEGQTRKTPRAVAGTSGCSESGVRYYAARSREANDTKSYFAIAEKLHQFIVADGYGHNGASCAAFSAGHLPRQISREFVQRAQRTPRGVAVDPMSGIKLGAEDAVADAWKDALAEGFAECERSAVQGQKGACGALFCAVARSGLYVGSIGIGRVVIGTEEADASVLCDEASNPHCAANSNEARRWILNAGESLPSGPTRFLGGEDAKRREPRFMGFPDVVRLRHASERRYVIMGSADIWADGLEAPVNAAVQAYRAGHSPADAVVEQSKVDSDVVAVVLVLPGALGTEHCQLPPHEDIALGLK